MLNRYTLCFEHEYLCRQALSSKDVHVLPSTVFDELFEQSIFALKRDWLGKHVVLKTTHYVGIIQTSHGHVIEILPKMAKQVADPTTMRFTLLRMLAKLPNTPFKTVPYQALMQLAKLPLLELFIQQALASFKQVLQRGLKQHYQTQHSNLPVLRGRLVINQHIKYNHSNQTLFYTAHDEYLPDCAENRLLKLALFYLERMITSGQARQTVYELTQRMAHIPCSSHPEQDWLQVKPQRNYTDYQQALQWAKLIIQGTSPVPVKGHYRAFSLLFDMNQLFESVVAYQFKQQLPAPYLLRPQHHDNALLTVNNQPQQQLRPDLLMVKNNQPVAILDSKWKLKSGDRFNQVKPSDEELYQMFAYAAAYLPQGGNVCLIYPYTSEFSGNIDPAVFTHIRDASVHLHLLPFCLQQEKLLDCDFLFKD